jgi:hypothetical protein
MTSVTASRNALTAVMKSDIPHRTRIFHLAKLGFGDSYRRRDARACHRRSSRLNRKQRGPRRTFPCGRVFDRHAAVAGTTRGSALLIVDPVLGPQTLGQAFINLEAGPIGERPAWFGRPALECLGAALPISRLLSLRSVGSTNPADRTSSPEFLDALGGLYLRTRARDQEHVWKQTRQVP